MKLTTAGESHGKALVAILEGLPYGVPVSEEKIRHALSLRQKGYGRSERQLSEKDEAQILSGVKDGYSTGSPVAFLIENHVVDSPKEAFCPRAGHADYAGAVKYGVADFSFVLERASARETAVRVAVGSVAEEYLLSFGIELGVRTVSVGNVEDGKNYPFENYQKSEESALGFLDDEKDGEAKKKVEESKERGDTLGGVVEIVVHGLKAGFGSFQTYEEKLDARLVGAAMSVQGAKGVEIGDGFALAKKQGSEAFDAFKAVENKIERSTNRAGGIEGGVSNGQEIVLRVAMKPIPTLQRETESVDLRSKEKARACVVRADVCAVKAFGVIEKGVIALEIASAVCARLGGDTLKEQKERYARLP